MAVQPATEDMFLTLAASSGTTEDEHIILWPRGLSARQPASPRPQLGATFIPGNPLGFA